jgi:hypothetical protein
VPGIGFSLWVRVCIAARARSLCSIPPDKENIPGSRNLNRYAIAITSSALGMSALKTAPNIEKMTMVIANAGNSRLIHILTFISTFLQNNPTFFKL